MRQRLLLLLLLLTGAVAGASAQGHAELTATLDPTTHQPRLQLRNLFGDTEWRRTIDGSVPLRLTWRVELWKVRTTLLGIRVDKLIPEGGGEWTYSIERQSTLRQYHLVQTLPGRPPRDLTYNDLDSLDVREFGTALTPSFQRPTAKGDYYYSVTIEFTTMTNEEFRKVLQNTSGGSSPLDVVVGNYFMPNDKVTVRTPVFKVP